MGVSVDLDHVLVARAEAAAEDGVGDVPVDVYGLEAGDCGDEAADQRQPHLLTHLTSPGAAAEDRTQRSDHVTASLGLTCSLASSNISLCWRTLSAMLSLQTETMCQCWVSGVSQWSEVFTARVSRHDWALVAPGPGWWGPLGDGAGVGPIVHTSTCPLHCLHHALGPGNLLVSKLCKEAADRRGQPRQETAGISWLAPTRENCV